MAETSPNSRQHHRSFGDRFRLTLRHGPHEWTFACTRGDERSLARRIHELAGDPAAPLDRYDAEVLCRYLAQIESEASAVPFHPGPPGPAA